MRTKRKANLSIVSVLRQKQSPPCRLRQTKTYRFGRWVPCHGLHAPFFRKKREVCNSPTDAGLPMIG